MELFGEVEHFGDFVEPDVASMECLQPEEIDVLLATQTPIIVDGAKLFSPKDHCNCKPSSEPVTVGACDGLVHACIEYQHKNSLIQHAITTTKPLSDESALQSVVLSESDQQRISRSQRHYSTALRHSQLVSKCDEEGVLRAMHVKLSADARAGVNEESCRDAVMHVVATAACHAGFHLSSDVVLEVFADVVIEHLRSLCARLRRTRDMELVMGSHGFSDAVDRTLFDCGAGGTRAVLLDYQRRVVDGYVAAREQHRLLCDQYSSSRHCADSVHLDESLLDDLLVGSSASDITVHSTLASGNIDMTAYPNMSFECADDSSSAAASECSGVVLGDYVKQEPSSVEE